GAMCQWVLDAGTGYASRSATSDVNGRLSMAVPAKPLFINCYAPDSMPVRVNRLDPAPGATATVDVALIARKRVGEPPIPRLRLDEARRFAAPVESAGLLAGDIVVAVDGLRVTDVGGQAVMQLLWNHDRAVPAELTVERGGTELKVSLPLR